MNKITIENTVDQAVMITINNKNFAIDPFETKEIEIYKPRKIALTANYYPFYLINWFFKEELTFDHEHTYFKIVPNKFLTIFGLIISSIFIINLLRNINNFNFSFLVIHGIFISVAVVLYYFTPKNNFIKIIKP
jgi:hypothetical protein